MCDINVSPWELSKAFYALAVLPAYGGSACASGSIGATNNSIASELH